MNKWEDSFNKQKISCMCSNDQGLFVPNRQLSIVIAGLLLLFFTFFITGYFLGKKSDIICTSERMQQDACADHRYNSALHTSLDVSQKVDEQPQEMPIVSDEIEATTENEMISYDVPQEIQEESIGNYYAQLIGFGTESAAQKFVKKIAAKGIPLQVKKHSSETAKGKTAHWYQVVTNAYANREELMVIVNRLTKEETLKGVRISTC